VPVGTPGFGVFPPPALRSSMRSGALVQIFDPSRSVLQHQVKVESVHFPPHSQHLSPQQKVEHIAWCVASTLSTPSPGLSPSVGGVPHAAASERTRAMNKERMSSR